MKLHAPSPLSFLTFFLLWMFTFSVFGSAIANLARSDIDSSLRSILAQRGTDGNQPCGSSPYQTPCHSNSASGLSLPFQSVLKLPALVISAAALGVKKVKGAAVGIATARDEDIEIRSLHLFHGPSEVCGTLYGPPCVAAQSTDVTPQYDSAASRPGVARIFKLPVLIINAMAFAAKKVRAAAVSVITAREEELEIRSEVCGSKYGPPCSVLPGASEGGFQYSSASGIRVPQVFKLPALIVGGLISGARKVAATAIPLPRNVKEVDEIPAPYNLELRAEPLRDPPDCGSSPFQRPCSAAAGIKAPSIFRIPNLLIDAVVLASKNIASAIPVENKTPTELSALIPSVELSRLSRALTPSLSSFKSLFPHDAQKEKLDERGYPAGYCHCNTLTCWPNCCADHSCDIVPTLQSTSPRLRVPRIFILPAIILSAIGSFPNAVVSAIPAPNLPSLEPLFPRTQKDQKLAERAFPDFCNYNEDTCWDSPPCCSNGSCFAPGTLQSDVPSQCALEVAWVGVLAMGVAVAGVI